MSPPVVVCAGRVYCDLVFSGLRSVPSPGNEIYADKLSLCTGGGAAITAWHLGQLNHPVELCANLPAPPFSEQVQNDLGDTVGLEYSAVSNEHEPQVTAVLTGAHDRSFVTRRVGNALPDNYLDSLARDNNSANRISHMHIGELTTLLENPELLTLAHTRQWTVSLDCAWDTDAMSATNAKELINGVDLFLPNESEYTELQKIGIDHKAAPTVVIKKGAAGAMAYSSTGTVEAAAENAPCIDSTGAGDAFNAGFIQAWLREKTLTECLQAGNRCGARAIAHVGGISQ